MTDNEKLIEQARVWVQSDILSSPVTTEALIKNLVLALRDAEKAHTPTDDEIRVATLAAVKKGAKSDAEAVRNYREAERVIRAALPHLSGVGVVAHTPTDDERAVSAAIDMASTVYGDYDDAQGALSDIHMLLAPIVAGFRSSEVPESTDDHHDGPHDDHRDPQGEPLRDHLGWDISLQVKPQSEPSDAQVEAAWEAYITAQEADPYDREGRMRAALRAAGGVR